MEGESGGTRSMIDELHYLVIQGDQMEGETDVTRVTLINIILGIENEIKC